MVKLKTPELLKAKKAVLKFLRDNDLSPFKDYTNHPKYGKEFRELVLRLNIERDKVLTKYPQTDSKRFKKYQKMKKDKKDKKAAIKAEVKTKVEKPAAEAKPAKEKKAKKEATEVKAKKEKVVKEKKVEKKKKKAKKEED